MVITVRKGKGKLYNQFVGNSGKLTKSGKVFKNNLLDTDFTSGQAIARKLK